MIWSRNNHNKCSLCEKQTSIYSSTKQRHKHNIEQFLDVIFQLHLTEIKQDDKHGNSERQTKLEEIVSPTRDKQVASGFKTEELVLAQDDTGDIFLCVSAINQFPISPEEEHRFWLLAVFHTNHKTEFLNTCAYRSHCTSQLLCFTPAEGAFKRV